MKSDKIVKNIIIIAIALAAAFLFYWLTGRGLAGKALLLFVLLCMLVKLTWKTILRIFK